MDIEIHTSSLTQIVPSHSQWYPYLFTDHENNQLCSKFKQLFFATCIFPYRTNSTLLELGAVYHGNT